MIGTMSEAVQVVIDKYPKGHQFFGNELKKECVKILPEARCAYVDSFLRMARRHRRGSFRVVNKNRSLYEKV